MSVSHPQPTIAAWAPRERIIAAERGDGRQLALRFIVLAVVLLDEGAGLVERDWPDHQAAHG